MQGIDVGQIGKLSNENLTKYGRDRHGCVHTGLFHTLPPAKANFGYTKKKCSLSGDEAVFDWTLKIFRLT